MNKDTLAELFEIHCQGALAAAFQHAGITPIKKQWDMLRGEREITVRDIGEISFATGLNFSMTLIEKRQPDDAA